MKVKVMPCLDMQAGRVVKGVRFVEIRDPGSEGLSRIARRRAGDVRRRV